MNLIIEMSKSLRTSNLFFDINQIPSRIALKSRNNNESLKLFTFWTSFTGGRRFNYQLKDSRLIFIPTSFKEEVNASEIARLREKATRQLRLFRLKGNQNRLSLKKRKHVQPFGSFGTNQNGFLIRKSQFKILLKERQQLFKKIEMKQKLIDLLFQEERDPNKLAISLRVPRWKAKQLVKEVCNNRPKLNKKIAKFTTKIELFRAVDNIKSPKNESFRTIKRISNDLKLTQRISNFSESTLYRVLRAKGFKYKPVVFHCNETENLKDYRIWFYKRYLELLSDPNEVIFYFDWSSFSDKNFQRRAWAGSSKRAVSKEVYTYAKIHLLAITSHERVECVEFVRGNLASLVIFEFLKRSIENLLTLQRVRGKVCTLILDNSPLNHSKAIKKFCVESRMKLLFTAPNSCFQNPIEFLFAKVKSPLKKHFTMNKYHK